jgi:hypothetical protein
MKLNRASNSIFIIPCWIFFLGESRHESKNMIDALHTQITIRSDMADSP